MKKILFVLLTAPLSLFAADYYADSAGGCDSNDGLSPAKAFRSLDKASRMLRPGDTLHLKAGAVFKETLYFHASGTAVKPIRVKGNGAVLSGLEPVPDGSWCDKGEGLWLSTNKMFWGACRPRVLLPDKTMISEEITDPSFKDPKLLRPGRAVWRAEGIWMRCEGGRRPQDYRLSGYYRVSGVEVVDRHHWIVEDLVVEHFTNDGVNVHGLCRGLFFLDIVARMNGDDGFSIHEDVQACVRGLHVWGNDYGISDISQSQSVFCGVVAESNRFCGVDFHGGIRILRDAEVRDNGRMQISVRSSLTGKRVNDPNPMLRPTVYLEDVRVRGGGGPALFVNKDCTVTAKSCSFAGTGKGLRLAGGRVHFDGCEVDGDLDIDKSPDCVFTTR